MNKYLKTAYQFGLLGGSLCVLSFYAISFLQPDPTNLNLIFGYLIVPISVFLAIKFFKDYTNEGYLSFSEGMTVGFVSYLILAMIATLGILVVLTLDSDLFILIKESKLMVLNENRETIVAQVGEESFGFTEASIQKLSPWDVAFNDGIWKILPGMFFSIIISIIFRKIKN